MSMSYVCLYLPQTGREERVEPTWISSPGGVARCRAIGEGRQGTRHEYYHDYDNGDGGFCLGYVFFEENCIGYPNRIILVYNL